MYTCEQLKGVPFHLMDLQRHRAKTALSAAAGPREYAVMTEEQGEGHDAVFRATEVEGRRFSFSKWRDFEHEVFHKNKNQLKMV